MLQELNQPAMFLLDGWTARQLHQKLFPTSVIFRDDLKTWALNRKRNLPTITATASL